MMIAGLPYDIPGEDLFKKLVQAWTNKAEAAKKSRSRWQEICNEIMMFYSRSAAAMFDQTYSKKFWKGNVQPRFRVNINLAYEYVAVMLPNLLWENPHRNVVPAKSIDVPQELFGQDEQGAAMLQTLQMEQAMLGGQGRLAAFLLQDWLNYTSREQPQGLLYHSTMATLDALLKGRGCLWTRPFQFPGSQRVVTGCFREPPENLLIDPDASSLADAKWIMLYHKQPYYEVEKRFGWPKNSLRDRGTMQSSWVASELVASSIPMSSQPKSGDNNDMVEWYEVFSKCGTGTRRVEMFEPVKLHLENLVGDYAYVAFSPSVHTPLNCRLDRLQNGASSEEVASWFRWPIDLFWKDDRWPVEVCDLYPNNDTNDPGQAWPIPPLEPALGEIKLLNILVPFLVNRVWLSSRDFWAVLGPHLEHYKKYIEQGGDMDIIPTPAVADDVRKVITIIQQPESRRDMWELIGLVETLFRKRTGLTLTAYGMNEDGTQNRSAEETIAKNRAVGVRPEFMQKMIVDWQSRAAASEAMVARKFIRGQHMADRIGPTLASMWDMVVGSDDAETICRQLDYTVEAASIRRPNKERDIANFMQAMQYWLSVITQHAGQTGNYDAVNAMMKIWGDLHDMDMSAAYIQPVQPDPAAMEMQQRQMQMEEAKMQAEIQGKQMDVETKMLDAQIRQQVAEADLQRKAVDTAMDQAARESEMQFDARKALLDLQLKSNMGVVDIMGQRQKLAQQAETDTVMSAIKTASTLQQAEAKARAARMAKPQAKGKRK